MTLEKNKEMGGGWKVGPHSFVYKTPQEAMEGILIAALYDGGDLFTPVIQTTTSLARLWVHDVNITVRYPYDPNFDIAQSGYMFPTRWNRFLKEYVDPVEQQYFFKQMDKNLPWEEAGMMCAQEADHTAGNCMQGISGHKPSAWQRGRVKINSRTTMFAPTGFLDMGYGVAVVNELVEAHDILPTELTLTWDVGYLQLVSWKMLLTLELMGLLPEDPHDLPDTNMGNMIGDHMIDSFNDDLPSLMMFARFGRKFKEFRETGSIRKNRPYTPFVPSFPPEFRYVEPVEEVDNHDETVANMITSDEEEAMEDLEEEEDEDKD